MNHQFVRNRMHFSSIWRHTNRTPQKIINSYRASPERITEHLNYRVFLLQAISSRGTKNPKKTPYEKNKTTALPYEKRHLILTTSAPLLLFEEAFIKRGPRVEDEAQTALKLTP